MILTRVDLMTPEIYKISELQDDTIDNSLA